MKILAPRLRYLGMISMSGRREYEFLAQGDQEQRFTMIVHDSDFLSHQISFQEAPDLCYQKLRAELDVADSSVANTIWITPEDVARYRETHQQAGAARGKRARQAQAV